MPQINQSLVSASPHLLVVDDDKRLRDLLVRYFEEQGFRVCSASNTTEARAQISANKPDLIILDIMMPGETGLEFSKRLRENKSFIPVIMLTAKNELSDRIWGLDQAGADDYVSKPFEPAELLSRVKAILRRAKNDSDPKTPIFSFGDFTFNLEESLLQHKGELIFLSSSELILLKTLSQTPRHALSRHDLAQRIGHRVSERTVDVQITRLRRKIADDPRHPRYIQTVRHVGYALYPD